MILIILVKKFVSPHILYETILVADITNLIKLNIAKNI